MAAGWSTLDLEGTRGNTHVREQPSLCINICRALLGRCRELGFRCTDCTWKLTMRPQIALCRCGSSLFLRGIPFGSRARKSLLLRCNSHLVLRRCPGGVSVATVYRCVVGGTYDCVKGTIVHSQARVWHIRSTRLRNRWLHGRKVRLLR